jgi:hypothetical protein
MAETITVVDAASLTRWRDAVRAVPMPAAVPEVEFALPGVDNRHLTSEAARFQRACGCTASGLAMTAAIVISILSVAFGPTPATAIPPLQWGSYLLFILLAATAGKLAGLFWARRQMLRLADAAERLIDRGNSR